MLAATYKQGQTFSVEDVPVAEIADNEMLLRVRAASICGTDVKIINNGHRKLRDGQKIVLGHEFVGDIARLGERVSGYEVGQRVGLAPNAGCGQCDACIRGESNYCPDYTAFGIDRDGGHADYVKVPAAFIAQGNVIPIPQDVSDLAASVLEPLSCVVNGIRVSRIRLGDTVVVYGVGPIGLMHVMLARLSGAGCVIAVDPVAARLEQAMELGADASINPENESVEERVKSLADGQGADAVITACPSRKAQEQAVSILAPAGRLCLFGGLPKGTDGICLDSNAVHYRNLLVTGSTGGSVEDYRIGLRLVSAKRLDLSRIVSDVFNMDEMAKAYEVAMNGPKGKVALVA